MNTILPLLPDVMMSWGKVRIVCGDSIRTASAARRGGTPERDTLYVRVGQRRETRWDTQICYGRLEEVLVCEVPNGKMWGEFSGETRLLAVITPCSTNGQDATARIVSHSRMVATIVTDIQTVVAVVGRIPTRGKWGIIDRGPGSVKPEFVPSVDYIDPEALEMVDE
ncbi:hypothetical protein B0H16DRAFT_1300412 [Mycena metata]|uniref:Uncharacterized protein n=1 Tax=Mycena metata TaxID=1033252 RepID=A0AAD7K662_9AGAR|nr:hypothetical protein B0H16DRAFT_1300412 [Mycena metata]